MSDPSASPGKTCLIFNPVAGRILRSPNLIKDAVAALEQHTGPIELRPTTGPRTAGAIARECIDAGAGLIIVAGGDGTINEVVAGMAGSEVPLAVLPAGTANVLAVETGMGTDLLSAAAAFGELQPRDVSLGLLSAPGKPARLFLMMAGAGLDARIVRLVRPEVKKRWGKLSYWQASFAQFGRSLPEFDVIVDGQHRRASYVLASRVKNYGGDLEIARHADLLSDDFAVVLFEGRSSLRYLKYFSGVLLDRMAGMKGITVTRARSLEFRPGNAEIDMQIDGEYAGLAPGRVEMAAQSIRLMLPRRFLDKARA